MIYQYHGSHCTGKTGKMAHKIFPVREKFGIWKFCQNTGKSQGTCFAQVVNSLILKVKDISIFASEISHFSFKLDISLPGQFCVCHKSCKWAHGKFAVQKGI